MRYENTINLSDANFKRIVGLKREIFHKILDFLKKNEKSHRGPKNRLLLEDQLLMIIFYIKDYRPFASIALDFNISESNCWVTLQK